MLLKEAQHAARNLARAPRFTVACVLTLTLAFSGTAALLNVLEAFVFRRLPVAAPDQLVGVYPASDETSVGFAPQELQELSARRTREIGIRIAVGATPAMVRRLVLSEAGRTLGIGVCLGGPAAVSAGQASQALLSGTPLNSQLLLVITVFAICGAAVLAAAWRAQRAATTPVALPCGQIEWRACAT